MPHNQIGFKPGIFLKIKIRKYVNYKNILRYRGKICIYLKYHTHSSDRLKI